MTGVPPSGSGLRPFGAEPAPQSQAKPLVPNAGWRPISKAPTDTTPIFAETFDGFRLIARWQDGFLNEDGEECGCWVAVEEDVHPEDWTDGVCWASNEDGNPSDPLVRFISIADIAKTAASRSVYGPRTDNYARIYQGAFRGAQLALALFASCDRSGEADETSERSGEGSAEGESAVPAQQGDAQLSPDPIPPNPNEDE